MKGSNMAFLREPVFSLQEAVLLPACGQHTTELVQCVAEEWSAVCHYSCTSQGQLHCRLTISHTTEGTAVAIAPTIAELHVCGQHTQLGRLVVAG